MAWEVSSKFYKLSVGGEEFKENLKISISCFEMVVLLNSLKWE